METQDLGERQGATEVDEKVEFLDQGEAPLEGPAGITTMDEGQSHTGPVEDPGPVLLRYNAYWHRVVGRLGAVCATSYMDGKLGRDGKINAGWAVASFGHPYRALVRGTQKVVKGHIDELSPEGVARTAIALAMEESSASGGVGGGGPGAKVERRFVDEVVASVLSSCNELPDLPSKVKALVAAAHLGRVSRDFLRLPIKPLVVTSEELANMSTSLLVQFFWALGRLPSDMTAEGTTDAVSNEIEARCLSTAAETILYVRALADMQAQKGILPSNIAFDVDLKSRTILDNLIGPLSALDSDRDVAKASGRCPDVAVVCETLQALIELQWYHEETAELCDKFTAEEAGRLRILGSRNSRHHTADCDQAFDLGRLEKLLIIYKAISGGETKKKSAFHVGRKIFSSFFNKIGAAL